MAISPSTVVVAPGAAQEFAVTVTGNGNESADVTWTVNGIAGGNAIIGSIAGTSANTALYTAPGITPTPSVLTVTATSVADTTKSASATVTIGCGATGVISPGSANLNLGQTQSFTASFCLADGASIVWDVNGIPGGNSSTGTIASAGEKTALYTAPADLPSPDTVTIHATASAVAGGSPSASATLTIISAVAIQIAPSSATLTPSQQQSFAATVTNTPDAAVAWSVNGVSGGNAVVGTIAPTSATSAEYTAPANLPSPPTVAITATSVADGSKSASAAVTIAGGISVTVTPGAATLALGARQSFAATVTNSLDTSVTWVVNGVPDGNATVGLVCVSGTSPCVAPNGPLSGTINYLAPAASGPPSNPVVLTATSHADPTKSGAAIITISVPLGPISVVISPAYAFMAPSGAAASTRQFTAAVENSTNTNVTWSVQSGVAGQGCSGAACGAIGADGTYTAPSSAPSPNAITVTATSVADATKSASATVVIANGPAIEVLLPSSVMAGAVESFPLEVKGLNFVAGSGTGASVILINGSARATTCTSATVCATALNPADVQNAGSPTIQVRNPGNPPELSNPVPFVIAPFDISVGTISLTSAQPLSAGNDIVVTEPTTAAESSPIDVDFVGYLAGTGCSVQGSPLEITHPASGSATVSICIHGTGLDPAFSYAFSGPGGAPGGDDIGVTASAVTGLFPNTIELDLQISSATEPGVRTLFVTTPNNDRAAATGMLEVK